MYQKTNNLLTELSKFDASCFFTKKRKNKSIFSGLMVYFPWLSINNQKTVQLFYLQRHKTLRVFSYMHTEEQRNKVQELLYKSTLSAKLMKSGHSWKISYQDWSTPEGLQSLLQIVSDLQKFCDKEDL